MKIASIGDVVDMNKRLAASDLHCKVHLRDA